MSTPSDPDPAPNDPNSFLSKPNAPMPPAAQPPAYHPVSPPPQQQPPPMYAGSPAYPPYYYAPPRRTNGMAIASMVLGIVWIYWIGSILALIFGYVARKQIEEHNESGGGMATAGIVLGWVGVGVLTIVLVGAFIASTSSS
jgi:hypothetical protein